MRMVEWKKLGEIGDVCMCKRIMKHQTFDKGDVPFYKIGTFGGIADAFINRDLFLEYKSKYSFPQKGDILLSASGTIGRTVVYNGEDAYFQDSNIVWISNNESQVTNAFLYYCYQIVDWKIDGGTIKRLYNYNLKNTVIPVPSLSEQNRIVGILDTFTSSIENLKQQVAERCKQYEHYRDQLLDLEGKEGVEIKTLGETCKLERGVRVVKKELKEEGNIPVFQNSLSPLGYFEKSNYPANTTFVICAGAAGEVGFCDKAFWAADDCTCIVCSLSVESKYVYHFLMTKQHLLKSQVRKASVPRLAKDVIGRLLIPIPSLEEQSRIVSILDTFEASISNLEAQLKEREKQYEYYRNKLLTFE
jgi:type I restriction enzyme S subunit